MAEQLRWNTREFSNSVYVGPRLELTGGKTREEILAELEHEKIMALRPEPGATRQCSKCHFDFVVDDAGWSWYPSGSYHEGSQQWGARWRHPIDDRTHTVNMVTFGARYEDPVYLCGDCKNLAAMQAQYATSVAGKLEARLRKRKEARARLWRRTRAFGVPFVLSFLVVSLLFHL